MSTYRRFTALVIIAALTLAGCSRDKSAEPSPEEAPTGERRKGNDAAIGKIRAGARALAQPQATVDYVAAEMEGLIKARTKSQALMHYDGYRVTMTTPTDRVTRITVQLTEAKPTMAQLTEAFGDPEENPKGMLYFHRSEATGSTIRILAEPVEMPAGENSLVKRVIIEGERAR